MKNYIARYKHMLALIGSLLLWGVSFPAMKLALETNDTYSVMFYRYLMAFILLIPMFMRKYKQNMETLAANKKLFMLGLISYAAMMLQIGGLNFTTSTKSVIITQTLIVVVPLPAYFILKEKLNARKAFGIVFSLIGALILSTNLQFDKIFQKGTATGDLMTLGSVLFFALYIVYTRKYAQTFNAFILYVPAVAATFFLSFFPVLFRDRWQLDMTGFLCCLFLAIFCTFFPSLMYNYAMQKIDAITTTILGPTEILSGAFLAFIFLGEHLTLIEMSGGVLILISVYIVATKAKNKRKRIHPG